jgi:leucyl/phenylalanyl-tRNA--protein transferase
MVPWLQPDSPFPDVRLALGPRSPAPGLLAAGADLSPDRLLDAYRHGIFPWFSEGQPVLWWSTDPRMVLDTGRFKISPSLNKTLKKIAADPAHWQVKFDSAFETVMRECAAPRKRGPETWISEEIIDGYCGLHRLGYAHSSELWHDGQLVAGAYGVGIGKMFYGESMFARVSDGSKVALAHLVHFLRQHGVTMIDCQQETAHLASLGAAPISRSAFIGHLQTAVLAAPVTGWAAGPTLFRDTP